MEGASTGLFSLKLVVDTNVWVDLDHAGLLTYVDETSFDWVVPDLLIDELEGLTLPTCVHVRSSDASELNEIIKVRGSRSALSAVDAILFVTVFAGGGILVTGDSALRAHADQEGIEVHGVIWLLQQFIDDAGLNRTEAADALQKMVRAGARLPKEIVSNQIRQWRRSTR